MAEAEAEAEESMQRLAYDKATKRQQQQRQQLLLFAVVALMDFIAVERLYESETLHVDDSLSAFLRAVSVFHLLLQTYFRTYLKRNRERERQLVKQILIKRQHENKLKNILEFYKS